jgi:hypothetical protein
MVEPSAEVTAVSDALLRFGRDMVTRHGQFYPFGAVLERDGEVTIVSGDLGHAWADSAELVELLYESLAARVGADGLRAAGVCTNERPRRGAPSIRAVVEHREARPVALVLPYRRRRLTGATQFGEFTAGPAEPRLFGA